MHITAAATETLYDAVIMLTWSDWFTELRSNRYHYATRFAREGLVVFVQPDISKKAYFFVETENPNILVLSLYKEYGELQSELLNAALAEKGILKPLLWVYNCYFTDFIQTKYNALVVYHATEDYLASDFPPYFKIGSKQRDAYQKTLDNTQLLISVSDGVESGILGNTNYFGSRQVVTNGVDFKFYTPASDQCSDILRGNDKKIIYQGNIFDKIDLELLDELTEELPDWEFLFCGKVLFKNKKWLSLLKKPNVRYLGLLSVDELRNQAWNATIGIIPFVKTDALVKRSFPLKAFEYLACGLPVISTPIDALTPFSDEIKFASSAQEFKQHILDLYTHRSDSIRLAKRLELAGTQDYDLKFIKVKELIAQEILSSDIKASSRPKLRVLILYDALSIHVKTITEHLESFSLYSENNITYASATGLIECNFDLAHYDVVVIHYSIRLSVTKSGSALSKDFADAIRKFGGFKVAFIQDDYEGTEICRRWIASLAIHYVYTCVPQDYIEQVYPAERFPGVKFEQSLTGFVPQSLMTSVDFIPLSTRKNHLAYRGRDLPFWYGDLGREKIEIGIRMKEYCKVYGVPSDIEWESEYRLYSNEWYSFIRNSRAVLGTESGCNIFDEDGALKEAITALITTRPDISYEEVYSLYLEEHDNKIKMNQVSPKIFEAIACGTILVLLEGEYSNIMEPDIHYISLKKDYSNVQDVFVKLNDIPALEKMRRRVYKDVVMSGLYTFHAFVSDFDQMLRKNLPGSIARINPTFFQFKSDESSRNDFVVAYSSARYRYLTFVTIVSPYLAPVIPRRMRSVIKKLMCI